MRIGRKEYYPVEVAEVRVTLICQTWDDIQGLWQ